MRFPRFRQTPKPDTIGALYGAIVAQARDATFYREYGVPDTVNGRLEMIILHAALLLRRLGNAEPEARRVGQELFDLFCRDMDHNLREMGIGDLGVPRQMRRIGEAFYGRLNAYQAALASSDPEAVAMALDRNVFGGTPAQGGPGVRQLDTYMRGAADALAAQPVEQLVRGEIRFPSPQAGG